MKKTRKSKAEKKAALEAAKAHPLVQAFVTRTDKPSKRPSSSKVDNETAKNIALVRKETGVEFRPLEKIFGLRSNSGMNAYRLVARGVKLLRSEAGHKAAETRSANEAAKIADAAKAKRSEAARKAAIASNAAQKAKREAAKVSHPEPLLVSVPVESVADEAVQTRELVESNA